MELDLLNAHSAAALRAAERGAPMSALDVARKALYRPGSAAWVARELERANPGARLVAELNRISPMQSSVDLARASMLPKSAELVARAAQAAHDIHSASSAADWSNAFDSTQMAEDVLRLTTPPSSALQVSLAAQATARIETNISAVARGVARLEQRLTLPDASTIADLIGRDGQFRSIAEQFSLDETALRRSVESVRLPWLDSANKLRSLHAMAALQGIGAAIHAGNGFEERVSTALRTQLGDWRDPLTFPQEVFNDAAARNALYLDRGLNPALSEIPNDALLQSMDIAHLRDEIPVPDQSSVPTTPPEVVAGVQGIELELRVTAFRRVTTFEAQFRLFIDAILSAAFGRDWPHTHSSKELRKEWIRRKQADRDRGQGLPLIEFAMFSEYAPLIEQHWPLFASAFGQPELVRESLQKLRVVRNAVMHGRPLTQVDELVLAVETQRIWDRIRSSRRH